MAKKNEVKSTNLFDPFNLCLTRAEKVIRAIALTLVFSLVAYGQETKPLPLPPESKKDLTIIQLQLEILNLKKQELERNIRDLLVAFLRANNIPESEFDKYQFDPKEYSFVKK